MPKSWRSSFKLTLLTLPQCTVTFQRTLFSALADSYRTWWAKNHVAPNCHEWDQWGKPHIWVTHSMSHKIEINWEGLLLPSVSQGTKKMKYFGRLVSPVEDFFGTQYDEDVMRGWLIEFPQQFGFKFAWNQHFQLYQSDLLVLVWLNFKYESCVAYLVFVAWL